MPTIPTIVQHQAFIGTIAMVAHDSRKPEIVAWATEHAATLRRYSLVCTGTTGLLVEKALGSCPAPDAQAIRITRLKSGPIGGDQQLGALIAEGAIDMLIFFWDPMEAQPHDVDVKALLRIASVYNIPTACNRSTADFLIASPLFLNGYTRYEDDHSGYTSRYDNK